MRPLFRHDPPPPLPVPAVLAFSSALFRSEALREVGRVDPGARAVGAAVSPMLPEAFALRSPRPFAEVARAIASSAVFTRHVQPLERVEEVADLAAISAALRREREATRPARVDLVGLPRALSRRVLRESDPGAAPAPGALLSALVAHGRLYLGASRIEDAPSAWPAGDPGYPTEPISRAASKLREALGHLDRPLEPGLSALDLGAAPGGFTSVLLERGSRVLAIDPAPLAPRVAGAANLEFIRDHAERVTLERIPPLDLITCDAVLAPSETAALVVRFAGRLSPGGRAIVTLKLRPSPPADEQLAGAAALFAPALELERLRHLHANRCEVTAFLRRPGG